MGQKTTKNNIKFCNNDCNKKKLLIDFTKFVKEQLLILQNDYYSENNLKQNMEQNLKQSNYVLNNLNELNFNNVKNYLIYCNEEQWNNHLNIIKQHHNNGNNNYNKNIGGNTMSKKELQKSLQYLYNSVNQNTLQQTTQFLPLNINSINNFIKQHKFLFYGTIGTIGVMSLISAVGLTVYITKRVMGVVRIVKDAIWFINIFGVGFNLIFNSERPTFEEINEKTNDLKLT